MKEPYQTPGEEPKKIPLKLLLRSKPVAEVETSVGRIYLYPLRVRDMTDFGRLEPADALDKVRDFLTSIGSLTLESDEAPERIPLNPEIAQALSVDEVEQLAEAYVQSSPCQTIRKGSGERKPVARKTDESASAYLIRLMTDEVSHQRESAKQLGEKLLGSSYGLIDQVRKSTSVFGSTLGALGNHETLLGSSSDLLDQVRKSTSALSSTLSAFEKLTKPPIVTSLNIQPVQTNHLNTMGDLLAQQARERADERAEEMELTRLTGQMTADSARALKDLVDAATTMMEQMDKRDRKTDQSTRTQINIAVGSVVSSAVFALVAAILAGLSYSQDRHNNTAGDQWQTKVLAAIEYGNQQRSSLERENQALLEQVKSQSARIADLEKTQRASVKSTASKQKPR